jgi:hypothetical protein
MKQLLTALVLVWFLSLTNTVWAATLTEITYGETGATVGSYVSASNAGFVLFEPVTAITSGSTITLTFPVGTSLTSSNLSTSDFTIAQAASALDLCTDAGVDTAPSNIAVNEPNRTITLTVATASLSRTVTLLACGLGEITVKTTAGLAENEIRHPTSVTNSGVFTVTTSVGDTGSLNNIAFVAAAASKLAFTGQPSGTGTAGQALASQPTVEIQDEFGNLTSSTAQITISAVLASDGTTAGGGTLSADTNPLAATAGEASFTGVSYTKAETIKLRATSSGLTQALSDSISISAAAANSLSKVSGDGQSAQINASLSNPFVVKLIDEFDNPVSGSTINFVLSSFPAGATGQNLSADSASSGSNGQASSTLTLGDLEGDYEVTVSSAGVSNVVFSATATSVPTPTPTPTPVESSVVQPVRGLTEAVKPEPPVCSDRAELGPPQIIAIQAISSTSVRLFFTPASGEFDSYVLAYGPDPGQTRFGVVRFGDRQSREIEVNYLEPGVTYYFQVRGQYGCAPGPWSSIQQGSTKTQSESQEVFKSSQFEIGVSEPQVTFEEGPQLESEPTLAPRATSRPRVGTRLLLPLNNLIAGLWHWLRQRL